MKKFITILILILLFAPIYVIATSPPVTIYLHASLSNEGGPLEGEKKVTVRLFSGEEKKEWVEIHKEVDFVNGNCYLNLGAINPFSAELLDISTPNFRLVIEGEEVIVPINSVPYALRAQTVERFPLDLNVNNVNIAKKMTIGGKKFKAELDIKGKMTVEQELTVSDNLLVMSRIGIGTITPQTTLDVIGTINATVFTGDGSYLTSILATSVTNDAIISSKIKDGTIINADLATGNFSNITGVGLLSNLDIIGGLEVATINVNDSLLFIDTERKVGIGTTKPMALLDVAGTINARAYIGDGSYLSNIVASIVADDSITSEKIEDESITSRDILDYTITSAKIAAGTIMNMNLTLGAFPNIIGLGTLSYLNVEGNIKLGEGGIIFPDGSTMLSAGASSVGAVSTSSDAYIIADQNADNSGAIYFKIGNENKMRILNDGKVGILKESPEYALDVGGTVNATAFIGDGSQLTNIMPTTVGDDSIITSKILDGAILNEDISASASISFSKLNIVKTDIVGLNIPTEDTRLSQSEVASFSIAEGFIKTVTDSDVDASANIAFSKLNIQKADIENLGIALQTTVNADLLRQRAISTTAPDSGEIYKYIGSEWLPTRDIYLTEAEVDAYVADNGYINGNNNLSSLTNLTDARSNLGLGSLAILGAIGTDEITDGEIIDDDIAANALIAFSKLKIIKADIVGLAIPAEVSLNAELIRQRVISTTAPGTSEIYKYSGTEWVPTRDIYLSEAEVDAHVSNNGVKPRYV
jgi:hypothetical protein